MNKIENINFFLNELRSNEGAIWLENESINVSIPKNNQSKEINDFIINNKSRLLSILNENKIFSEETFQQVMIVKDNDLSCYPLSYAQERVWFIEQYEERTTIFHMQEIAELAIDTDLEGIKYALRKIVVRHEVLRSTTEQGEYGIQVVHHEPLAIEELTIANNKNLESLIREDFNRPFDLSTEYPIRAKLYTVEADKAAAGHHVNKVILLINIHHIARDAWSMGILQKELFVYYESYINKNTTFDLPALTIQYKDYSVWQRHYLTGKILEKQLDYWKNKLLGFQTLALPTDFPRPNKIDRRGSSQEFTINKNTSWQLRKLTQKYGVTLQGVMLSSINILLSKYTGQEDIITGSWIANRHHRQTEELIGLFANTMVNRTLLNDSQNYADLIQQVHQEQVEAQLHQDLPIEKLIDALEIERDTSRNNIFQVRFEVQSFSNRNNTLTQQKKYLKPYPVENIRGISDFDLSIIIDDSQEELLGQIDYAICLFREDTITRLIDNYAYLLDQLTEAPDKPYSEISLLHAEEYRKVIYEWNATDKDYPKDKTIQELFEEQAAKTPHNIAIVYEEQKLTYKELDEKSNQLARNIRAQYEQRTKQLLAPDTIIIICLDRGIEMVIGMLAALKAGAAYLPIDPGYPQERINYIVEDTGAELILSQKYLCKNNHTKLPQDKVIHIDLAEELYKENTVANLPKYTKATDIAYVVYTSGTTGKPKASLIEHHSFVNLNNWYSKEFNLTASDSFIICSEICFDLTQKNYFSCLINGSTLYIPKSGDFDPENIASIILENKVNRINCAPSAFTPILEKIHLKKDTYSFDYIFLGGEPIPDNLMQTIKTKMADGYLVNTYGPSECCDVTTFFPSAYKDIPDDTFPLGIPVHNFKHYVLDSNRQPVPVGVIGELYLSGVGLSRGYLNQPELTKERFILNPFATEFQKQNGYSQLYKTGDLVSWLPNGNLKYIGRNDDQVKIRGYRIELSEIENALLQIQGIKQCCVLAKDRGEKEAGNKYLVAYFIPDTQDGQINSTIVQSLLAQTLPEYMVPAQFVSMDSFPLTTNGKLDKRALPEVSHTLPEADHVEPATEIEASLCKIWQELLGIEKIGVTNDFFRIGGNSLLAIRISHRMSKLIGCDVKVADVFIYKTIRQILVNTIGKKQVSIPTNNSSKAALSFAQERLWFIEKYEEGTNAYHLPFIYELNEGTDKEAIKYALRQIVSRHEVLRSTIETVTEFDYNIQRIHVEGLPIEEFILTDKEDHLSILKKEINRPFNLSAEYPIRVKLYNITSTQPYSQDKTLLLINMHHISSDGWSMGVFLKEFLAYYEAYVNKSKAFRLPDLEIQYKDYAVWQKKYLTGETVEKQLTYWKNKLSGYKRLTFQTDYQRPGKVDYKGARQYFTIPEETSHKLRKLAKSYGVSLHSLMLSSFSILMNKYTNQEDIIIGSPIANRHHRQTEGLIGFFVNTQVNRVFLNKLQSFPNLVKQVHQEQIEAQLYQDLPFEKLVNELGIAQDPSLHPVFQILFTVHSFDQQESTPDMEMKYLSPHAIDHVYEVEKLDLSIYIDDGEKEFKGLISYATSLFKKETIENLISHFSYLLTQLAENPDKPYSHFGILNQNEFHNIVYRWNETDKDYSPHKTIIDLLEEQVAKTPDKTAIVFKNQELSYQQLHSESDKIANYLIENCGVNLNDTVGIMLNRSEKVIVAMLSVLKAGAAYVYIDPEYPHTRKEFIIKDASIKVLITQADYIFDLEFYNGNIFAMDVQMNSIEDAVPVLKRKLTPDDLAYIIHTSGTTGTPKGVMINHKGFANFIQFQIDFLEIKTKDVALQFASYVFDASVAEIYTTLLTGAKLLIASDELKKDGQLLCNYIKSNNVTIADIPPALLTVLPCNELPSLKTIIIGGQSCPAETIKRWNSGRRLIIAYGPTETTICASMHQYTEGDLNTNIGKPIKNSRVYVLDSNLNAVPIGVTGELYIGGAGLAIGYLNHAETEQYFIPNPYATETDIAKGYTRIYKTGDLAKWLPNGELEYTGRNDDQLKIRGFRIELGEIENALSKIEGISQSCVLAREKTAENGNVKYLAAYYVPIDGNDISATILDRLFQLLPEYMIPNAIVMMEALPLTISGKIDKRALPDPEFTSLTEEYILPTNEIEAEVCKIWQTVLGLKKVGVTDNFFRIGGNSILAIQISHKMSEAFVSDIKVADIFRLKNIRGLLENISTSSIAQENIEKSF